VNDVELSNAKKSVARFLAAMATNDQQALIALLSEHVTWWVPSSAEDRIERPLQGRQRVSELASGQRLRTFRHGTTNWEIQHVTAESDRVSVLAQRRSITSGGRPYNVQYHWLFRFAGGLIAEVWEVMDTASARAQLS
jgi:ketosteroid isomerase-like protein